MYGAAHHLIGTLVSQTNASAILAARLAEISHLLMVPPELRCRYPELQQLATEAGQDQSYIRRFAFPTNDSDGGDYSAPRRAVFKAVGALDPVVDLLRVLSFPSSYAGTRWTEPFYPSAFAVNGYSVLDQGLLKQQMGEVQEALVYARHKAVETKNPLWAYALGRLASDPQDLAVIRDAERILLDEQDGTDDRRILFAWLLAYEARILLISGHTDEALTVAIRLSSAPLTIGLWRSPNPWLYVVEGGTTFLLARGDIFSARSWSVALSSLRQHLEPFSQNDVDPLTAVAWDEALAPGIIGGNRRRNHSNRMPTELAAALDLLPSDSLVILSRTPGLDPRWRRPILGAAWIRYFMLGRTRQFERLFPEVKEAFPETVSDIDGIQSAWLPFMKQRLITRMLLRLPGLSPRVTWNRDVPISYIRETASTSIYDIDPTNPNDGNWWCPVDAKRARRDAFAELTAQLTSAWAVGSPEYFSTVFRSDRLPSQPSIDALAELWLKKIWLTRETDSSELTALSEVQSAPYLLTRNAVAWAAHSNSITRWLGLDRDLPETLALAVRSTRYGCRVAEPLGPASKAAWSALHKIAPDSEWARRTPYWFAEQAAAANN